MAIPLTFCSRLNPLIGASSPATTRRFSSPALQDRIWCGSRRFKKKAPWCQANSYPHSFLTVGVTFFPTPSLCWKAPRPAAQLERHHLHGWCALEISDHGHFLWRDRACLTSHSQSAPLGPHDSAAWQRMCRLLLERDGKSMLESMQVISFCLSFEDFAHLNNACTTTSSLETFKSFRWRIRWSCLLVSLRNSSVSIHCENPWRLALHMPILSLAFPKSQFPAATVALTDCPEKLANLLLPPEPGRVIHMHLPAAAIPRHP